MKQKEALTKAQEGAQVKEKFKQIEQAHISDREASQVEFKNYKAMMMMKERTIEEEHTKKVQEFKTAVMDMKAGFDNRVGEFKKQIDDFRKNNEAIDQLKKAHQKEMAEHV